MGGGRPELSRAAREARSSRGGGEPARLERLLRHPGHDLAPGILDRPGDERGHVADLLAAKREHVEGERQIALLAGVPAVERERRLSVGAHRKGAPAPLARERVADEEGLDPVAAPVPGPHRRHREGRILGQHRDHHLDVAALPGIDVGLDQRPHPLVAERAQGRLLALLWQPRGDRLRAAAGRCSPTRSWSQRLRGPRAEKPNLAQDQDRALARGQVLKRGDEGELDRLALLIAGLGPGGAAATARRSSG